MAHANSRILIAIVAAILAANQAVAQTIDRIAGNGVDASTGDGGPALAASVNALGIAVDLSGNLYLADRIYHRIRKVDPAGIITTVAGDGTVGSGGDNGLATAAQLNYPRWIASDAAGNLYINDGFNHRIRKVSTSGVITNVVGTGNTPPSPGTPPVDGVQATTVDIDPSGIALDAAGNLYIATGCAHRIRKVDTNGIITTVAGNGVLGPTGDGTQATTAALGCIYSIAVTPAGEIYVADFNRVRKIGTNGIIDTVPGGALTFQPAGIAPDAAGNIYVTASNTLLTSVIQKIYKIGTDGTLSLAAGNGTTSSTGDGGPAAAATVNYPLDLVMDSAGNLTFVELFRIRRIFASTADLSVTQATPDPATVGKDSVYSLTVANAGPAAAKWVALADTPPAGSSFIWASPGCVNASGRVTCDLGTLASGDSKQVKVVVRPSAPGAMTNNATVNGAAFDPVKATNATALGVTAVAAAPGTAISRYRLYSDVTKEHHFTTDLNEYNVLGTLVGTWVQEGTVGKVLNNPGSFGGVQAVPYYRLYDNNTRWHHWTTDPNEYYTLGFVYSGWNMEGVDGYILPTQAPGTTQLYRLNYPALGALHHWTIDANEYNTLITPAYGWVGEGGAGFVIL